MRPSTSMSGNWRRMKLMIARNESCSGRSGRSGGSTNDFCIVHERGGIQLALAQQKVERDEPEKAAGLADLHGLERNAQDEHRQHYTDRMLDLAAAAVDFAQEHHEDDRDDEEPDEAAFHDCA